MPQQTAEQQPGAAAAEAPASPHSGGGADAADCSCGDVHADPTGPMTAEDKKRAAAKAKRQRQKAKEKEKKAAAAAGGAAPAEAAPAAEAQATPASGSPRAAAEERRKQADAKRALAMALMGRGGPGVKSGEPKTHKFWSTQPVPQVEEELQQAEQRPEGSIDVAKTPADVRQTPYDLPDGLEWWDPDVTHQPTMERVYRLLRDHYVEDDDAMFRFNYSESFLRWALLPPGYKPKWHVAIRSIQEPEGDLIGFITGIPVHIRVGKKTMRMCEINFLCVNKNAREKGLAPTLIQEVTRRVNLTGVWQAVYTAGIVLPTPIGRCQYWHRSLNPQKLVQIGFSSVPRRFERFSKPMDQLKKHYSLPAEPKTAGLRQMTKKDHKQVRQLLEEYLKKFMIAPAFTNDEIVHWFLPKEDVIDTYVVQDPETQKLTDVLSFYSLPSTVIGSGRHKTLRAAYSYYNVAQTVPFDQLLNDALILAKKRDFDVFNALDIMDNQPCFEKLKFGPGDGHLQYYLFNWRCPAMQPNQIGLVLL
eukprot:TRINITY_DN14354_c0_g1_i1.p1 TRINITY_DN14354_c0_g1~~TRINITY_DN14354_c0_g1_i1.p1  ORF type:complete len:559 (+),score=188.98 TRINITY_DN14354_c0_g1_i1:88-1677(+)